MDVQSFDTETFLISPGCGAPPMVTYQWKVNRDKAEIIHGKDSATYRIVRDFLEDRHIYINGHNVAFDMAVLCAYNPELIPLVFQAYASDRVTCTKVREVLRDIACGEFEGRYPGSTGEEEDRVGRKWGYSLAETLERNTGATLDKSDPWRLRYGTLWDVPIEAFPPDALSYALLDAEAQADTFFAQGLRINPSYLDDQHRQSRAAFWIRLMELWGIRTHAPSVEHFHKLTLEEYHKDKDLLIKNLLVRPDVKGSRDTKRAAERMVSVLKELGEDLILTDTGEDVRKETEKQEGRKVSPWEIWNTHKQYVSLSEDAILSTGDDLLKSYQQYGSLKTTISRVERLYKGTEIPLQASFSSLVATGRTSCRMGDVEEGVSPPSWGFQLQNIPRKVGLRECFIARDDKLLCSVDYNGMELRSWAQVCLWSVGHSRLAQVLNAGLDPHTELGASLAQISKEEAYRLVRAGDQKFKDDFRQTAKIGNFGFQGGMGPAALRTQARKEYRVIISLEAAKHLRSKWREEWPESFDYFDWINAQGDNLASVSHFRSNRVRGFIPYTVRCNTFFQGLAADAAKDAGWQIAWECYVDTTSPLYGCRIVAFIHDEFILEVPAHPERAHLAAHRLRDIMVSVAQRWIPDVEITAEPALMKHWTKGVKTKYVDGLLVRGDL